MTRRFVPSLIDLTADEGRCTVTRQEAEPEGLCEAIRVVAGGDFYHDTAIASKVIAQVGRNYESRARRSRELTPREVAVPHRRGGAKLRSRQ